MTHLLYAGYDQLILQQEVTNVSHRGKPTMQVSLLSALEREGIQGRIKPGDPTSRENVLELPAIDTRIKPDRKGRFFINHVVKQKPLHLNRAATVKHALRAADICALALRETGTTVSETYLHELTQNVDFVGWKSGPPNPNRWVIRPGWDLVREDRKSFNAGDGRMRIYCKSDEIEANPEKAYIEDVWAEEGYTPEMGDVYRVEFQSQRGDFGGRWPEGNAMWAHWTSRVELKWGGGRRRRQRKDRLRVDRSWRTIREAIFPELFEETPGMRPTRRLSNEHRLAQARGRFLAATAYIATLLGIEGREPEDIFGQLLPLLDANDPTWRKGLEVRLSRARGESGALPERPVEADSTQFQQPSHPLGTACRAPGARS